MDAGDRVTVRIISLVGIITEISTFIRYAANLSNCGFCHSKLWNDHFKLWNEMYCTMSFVMFHLKTGRKGVAKVTGVFQQVLFHKLESLVNAFILLFQIRMHIQVECSDDIRVVSYDREIYYLYQM